ncbi:MAG: MFS transporter [Planctomycetes bacterium]|nr:MFS transporter [Planctomycetota bacterium]
MSDLANTTKHKTFLGHPLGLYVLFFTEMWERFSYYGMRALLITYMVNYFKWAQSDASSVYKWYTTLVYVTPILGGFMADRYLGNTWAVIIGAGLMAVGHFLMAFEANNIFYAALIFLIIGNGFFKPNMSTQVGRLYPPNDRRRDGAYTIFYMGINLGAFLSPLACGWLQENTVGEYHSGFALAGIGMVIGLLTYLIGLPLIKEVPIVEMKEEKLNQISDQPLSEKNADQTPSVLGSFSNLAVKSLLFGAVFLVCVACWKGSSNPISAAPTLISGVSLLVVYWIASQLQNAMRDRFLTIVALGFFAIFFWAAFEQAGNALNLWADKTTNRYLFKAMPEESKYPPSIDSVVVKEGETTSVSPLGKPSFLGLFKLKDKKNEGGFGFDPVPTAWFQSINALAIFIMAPLFAWIWLRMDLSIPIKMTLGIFSMALSFVVMIGAALVENVPLVADFKGDQLPSSITIGKNGELLLNEIDSKEVYPIQGGRLTYDSAKKQFMIRGVFADVERDRVARTSAPSDFHLALEDISKELSKQKNTNNAFPIELKLPDSVVGFDIRYAGLPESMVKFNAQNNTLLFSGTLAEKDIKALLLAGANPDFRNSMDVLFVGSSKFKVSSAWLFWSYILATIGELCLSPVGLSMANKLAPAKFATMIMGLWLLVSAFGNFAAGALGETYGTISPVEYFTYTTAAIAASGCVLFVISRKLTLMMHGVK